MSKLKVGVIGTGRIGKNHIATIVNRVPNAEIVMVADVFIDGAKAVAAEFGIANVTANYKDILSCPEIDAVLICSPTNTHSQYIVEAAEAGKHISVKNLLILTLVELKRHCCC